MPFVVDIPLCDGKFTARGHSRPSGAQIQSVSRSTRKRVKEENPEAILIDTLMTLCDGWDVKDENDSPIPWTREGVESAPIDILVELSDALQEFIQKGATIDTKLRAIAEEMANKDDPRLPQVMELINPGN
jgi:hypothetical protein